MTLSMKDIPVLYEDESVLVINKPAGLTVHPGGNHPDITLSEILLEAYPQLKGVGEPMKIVGKGGEEIVIERPGIVHRLDKETSGVMLVAKTQEAFTFFKEQFLNREISKTYHAFLYGWPKEDKGKIETVISRSKSDIRMWTAGRGGRGTEREAITQYEVLKRFSLNEKEFIGKGTTEEGNFSYVAFYPKTGRTHQIRVHARYLNHPIVGDSLYAPKRPPALGFQRLALHAKEITFTLPSGEKKTVSAPLPPDFETALAL